MLNFMVGWPCSLNMWIIIIIYIIILNILISGLGSSIGIMTGYRLDGPGIESQWGEIFRTPPEQPWGPPSLLYNGYRVFPGGSKRPGRDADPSPCSSAKVWKQSRAIPLLSLRAFVACKKGETYLNINYKLYNLYKVTILLTNGNGRHILLTLCVRRPFQL
jgi:hypothetical protein